ncbi:glycosidase [bacterium]|nr:glycosidase [bacterium]
MSSAAGFAQRSDVKINADTEGFTLQIDGNDFMINGMNWDYYPVGTNFNYSLWNQPDRFIKEALDREMSLLQNMGVNAIRQYTGIPPRWITYIYETYGIYTVLNHSFGRYGITVNGSWNENTDYADQRVREVLLAETAALAESCKDTPGLLMYLLGNENNYGLFWEGAESEDIPVKDRESTRRARPMYRLFDDAARNMKTIDASHPVAMCNGDLLFLDIIAEECGNIDIFGTNMYRGVSFRDAFERVRNMLDIPVMITEFGADAFNAMKGEEDQASQAWYLLGNWREIYEEAAGLGKNGNSIGGFTFQFSDGWWKYGQTSNLDIHDSDASWANGGYPDDLEPGENNMNEEWFGICAKGRTDANGHYQLYPRAAYYALKAAHQVNPYAARMSGEKIREHFSAIQITDAVLTARGDRAAVTAEQSGALRVSGLRMETTTFNTGGDRVSTPDKPVAGEQTYPDALGFDHMESFYADIEAKPSEYLRGFASFNVLGNVATNPIDEIFYENRGRPASVKSRQGDLQLTSLNRIAVYRAGISWKHRWFNLEGFYRTGHYHWGYEGDFFGLYREANYGPNIDIYNGMAPLGIELAGKKLLNGLKVAFGPQLWWGANPAVLVKYSRGIGPFFLTGIYHEDIAKQESAVSSLAIPVPPTRRVTLHIETKLAGIGIEIGGIWAGAPRIGESFQIVDGGPGHYTVYQDKIKARDTWGGKIKLTYAIGPVKWYGQAAAMGLVAGGGSDMTQTYTGWKLKDSGSGNQYHLLTGCAYSVGHLQLAPNVLWQKPIEGPIPGDVPAPGRPRNIIDDPFAVRGNREMTAGEFLVTWDPTPATWMYSWDSDIIEDAPLAVSAGFVYKHQPTTIDAAPYFDKDGRTIYVHPGGVPAHDLREAHARIVSKPGTRFGIIANLYAGDGEPNGDDERLIHRYGGDLRIVWGQTRLMSFIKVNDWGPYDYHCDHNLTFPLQVMIDLSTSFGKPLWFDLPQTRLGIRFTRRTLDQYSTRYYPDPSLDYSDADLDLSGYPRGSEWEIRTYLHFNISM